MMQVQLPSKDRQAVHDLDTDEIDLKASEEANRDNASMWIHQLLGGGYTSGKGLARVALNRGPVGQFLAGAVAQVAFWVGFPAVLACAAKDHHDANLYAKAAEQMGISDG
ncbi:hypothetical protein ACFL6C_08300 [Myxococcota bacterium]